MKKIFAVLFIMSLTLCLSCVVAVCQKNQRLISEESIINVQHTPNDPNELFLSSLPIDENGNYIYPQTYGGAYLDNGIYMFLIVADDFSEYQYLKDAFSNVEFRQVEYSLNYLQNLADEYIMTYDSDVETVFGSGVDVRENRSFIMVDEETLSHKTNDNVSPLIFKLGKPLYLC